MTNVKKVAVERNLESKMRDGTVLRADAYRPKVAGKFPVLLCRTPYSKEREQHLEIGREMADRGYVVVIQDVRGRYASDGEFKPGFYSADHCDREDGYDTVEWAASLPWSTGKVGTFGNSYNGWTQWELADTRPPHLVCMFATGIAANLLDRELGGVLRLGRVLFWTINTLSPDERRRSGVRWGPKTVAGAEEWPPIQLFVMGANRWRGENEWPLARTRWTEYYLHSSGAANSAAGDGALSPSPPGEEPPDTYLYDPRNPVMTLYNPNGQQEPWDQRRIDGRLDILVYQTDPLQTPLEVTGPVIVKLWAASSVRDTDFVAKLQDVWPDGFVQELCHGIIRARYRESYETPSLIKPGDVYEYTIQINPTSNLFKEGHCIRVDISSSDFPNFDRNLNTGAKEYGDPAIVTARQTIFHDSTKPSRIILPVIPLD